ncbi:MAG: hypothetical protein SOZ66_04265 [Candidatus Cryptobacteroides sp.]|nr:hypothetical protein [Candidatus Cryptobacteroides sp.]
MEPLYKHLFALMCVVFLSIVSCTPEKDIIGEDEQNLAAILPGVIVDEYSDEGDEIDRIPDFSRTGYHYSDDPIPDYDKVIVTLYPTGDKTDRSDEINAAINKADGKTNSVVLLKAGDYYVSKQINIRQSHVCLRGEGGGKDDWKTRIIACGNGEMENCINIGNRVINPTIDQSSVTAIAEDYVPVGRLWLEIENVSGFNVRDRIVIFRPATAKWIHDIRMDRISDGENWNPDDMDMFHERIITSIVGNRIYLDAPVVMAIDSAYGGGWIAKIHLDRVVESGVEDVFLESTFNGDPSDEDHCRNGIKFTASEHCWARRISGRHFIFSLVGQGSSSKNITIEDCHSFEPVSLITGSRRYAFNAGQRSALGLVIRCSADNDRHSFTTTGKAPGPLAFVHCKATNCHSETSPHCFWATGILYDCLIQDSRQLSVQDNDFYGTGASHGWQASCVVMWNCEAPLLVCQSPWTAEGHHPTGKNYCIGCIGTKKLSTVKVNGQYLNDRPQGEWYPDPGAGASNTAHVTSGTYFGAKAMGLSLYEAQLAARKAEGIRAIPANWYL